jgi:hypothetical protein
MWLLIVACPAAVYANMGFGAINVIEWINHRRSNMRKEDAGDSAAPPVVTAPGISLLETDAGEA